VKEIRQGDRYFDFKQFKADIPPIVRAMDNIHDNTVFPLPQQAEESRLKRRMGLGVTGLANAVEALGYQYGSEGFMEVTEMIFKVYRDGIYAASVDLAKEKGAFPMFEADPYLSAEFIQTLPAYIREGIAKHGIRNSHLLSMAPTGTISLTADNVSGGIEPVFSHSYDRTIQTVDGPIVEEVKDYAYRYWDIKGRTSGECSADDHLAVLAMATKYVDSAVSKTVNVSPDMPWDEFKEIYVKAWQMGCKGITTFNSGGKRFGILVEKKEEAEEDSGEAKACFIDAKTGQRECS
jgi:ribonucleoside-diphosphate reductase alpha chain